MLKFILGVLLMSSVLFSQDIIVLDKENFYVKDKALHYKDGDKLVNGVVRYYKNKKRGIYYDAMYVDGKKNGIEEYYYRKKLAAKTTYKNGYKDGMEYWFKYGKIGSTYLYEKNEDVEKIWYYNYEKKIVKTSKIKSNGVSHKIRYTKSGNIEYDCKTKYPRLVGKCVVYYPTGELLGEITQNGKKYSGFVYLKNGNKTKAIREDHNRMQHDTMGQKGHIKSIKERLKK